MYVYCVCHINILYTHIHIYSMFILSVLGLGQRTKNPRIVKCLFSLTFKCNNRQIHISYRKHNIFNISTIFKFFSEPGKFRIFSHCDCVKT